MPEPTQAGSRRAWPGVEPAFRTAVSHSIVSSAKTSLFQLHFTCSVKSRSFTVCILHISHMCIMVHRGMVGHSTKWRLHESETQLRIWKNLLCTALFFLHISFPTACVWQESSKSSQISSRGRQVILSCWWSSGNLSHFAYLAQCLHFLFPQKSRGWVLVSRWCVVLTGGSSMSQQLSWAPLRMAALGEQAQGHWHTTGQSLLRDVRCLLSVWRVLPWFFCTCRLESGFAICLKHGEISRSRITQSKHFGRLFRFPQRSSMEKPNHTQSDVTPPHPVKETSLHVPSCHRAPQQCAGAVYKRRWMQGSGGGWYSSPVQLCVGSLERTLSSFMLRPAGRMKSCPMQGPFLSICYKSVLLTGCIWEWAPIIGRVYVQPGPRPAVTQPFLWHRNGAGQW